ncbi:MAG: glycosyltransferase [Candidatus Brocadiaceae bacterium]|jgi:tetratricopeptide (TPR) repeat protein
MTPPKVTVLTATYNRPRYLPAAIRSVVAQDMPDWEMLVINDGGVDVAGVVEEFGDERIRYFDRPENRGKAACLNFGLERARGEYVAYLDDDDLWYPYHLHALAEVLDREPDTGVAYSDLYKVVVLVTADRRRVPLEKRVDVCRDYNRMFMFHFNHTLHVSLMHRKELLTRAGGYNENVRVLIDWDLTRRLSFYTDFRHVRAVTGEYYVPLKDSDRISDVEREDEKRYRLNLRRIRGGLPPEPWPRVEKVTVVFPVRQWDGRTPRILRYFADRLDYPCRIVLVDRTGSADGPRKCRRILGVPEGLESFRVIPGSRDVPLHEAYLAGARAAESDYCYLPSEQLCLAKDMRLLEAVSHILGESASAVRWSCDGEEGAPYDVFVRTDVLRELGGAPPKEWPEARTLPPDWIPEALEPDYLLRFARHCEEEGDFAAARDLLLRAARMEKGGTGSPYVVQHLARVCFRLGDFGPAESMCRDLIELGYGADNYVRLGQIRQNRGRHAEAAQAYREGLRMIGLGEDDLQSDVFPLAGPVEFQVFCAMAGLGECLTELGRGQEAAQVLRRAARLRADSARPYVAFARLFMSAGDLARAEEALTAAARQPGGDRSAGVAAALAEVHERQGNVELACRQWERALDCAPDNWRYLQRLIRTKEAAGEAQEVLERCRGFLSLRPGHAQALAEFGRLCLDQGLTEEAGEAARRATLLAPGDPAVGELKARLEAVRSPGADD